jgi:hypothetical protein
MSRKEPEPLHIFIPRSVNPLVAVLVALTCFLMGLLMEARADERSESLFLIIELVDGSRIHATYPAGSLPLQTSVGHLRVGMELINRVDFAGDQGQVKLYFENGDVLQGVCEVDRLTVQTLLGVQTISLAVVSSIAVMKHSPTNGLILHYVLDDEEGSVITDRSGNGNDGVAYGSAARRVGRTHYREFDGRNSYIACPDAPSLNMSGAMSVLVWIKPTLWGTGESNGIISKKRDDRSSGYVLYNDGYHPQKLNLRVRGTAGVADMLHSRSEVEADVMQHWAVTLDPDNGVVRIYKNGRLDTMYTSIQVGDMTNDLPLHIGHAQTWGGYFHGRIGNLMLYNVALSPGEVRRVFESQERSER